MECVTLVPKEFLCKTRNFHFLREIQLKLSYFAFFYRKLATNVTFPGPMPFSAILNPKQQHVSTFEKCHSHARGALALEAGFFGNFGVDRQKIRILWPIRRTPLA